MSERALRRTRCLTAVENMPPATKAEFRAIVENVGPLQEWPLIELELMTQSNRNVTTIKYAERYKLTLFMLGNACPPSLYAKWLIGRRMLRDTAACEHVISLINDHQDGKLASKTTWVLPSKVTCDYKDGLGGRGRTHPWDGVGAPPPRGAGNMFFVKPVETPLWAHAHPGEWWLAVGVLRAQNVNALPIPRGFTAAAGSEREVKIVPWHDDGGCYQWAPDDMADEDGTSPMPVRPSKVSRSV